MLATYIQAGIFSTVMGYAVKNYHYIYFSVSHYVRKDNFPQRCFQFSHFPSFDSSIDAPLHCNCKPFVSNLPSVFVWLISQTTKAFREVRGGSKYAGNVFICQRRLGSLCRPQGLFMCVDCLLDLAQTQLKVY